MKETLKINKIKLLLLIILPAIIMSLITGTVVYSRLNKTGKVTSTNNRHVNEFINVYNKLLDEYYEKLDETKVIDAAINGMLSYTGDDYTIYMDENATEDLNDKLNGSYEGIGIRIAVNENNEIYVYEIFDDSPASKAGLQIGDILKSINDESLEGKTPTEASTIIKNSKEGKVKITALRNGENVTFDLVRKNLIVPVIKSSIKEVNSKKIGYIYIETFSSTVDTQVLTTLTSMEKEGIDSLILDVRYNTGGYLTACTKIIEMFLKKDSLMYSIKSKKDSEEYRDTTDEHRNYKVAVLINNSSASASEILASSLKYSYGATIIGEKSYGKGKVQTTGKLSDGTMIKYTSALWYMPNGECLDKKGLTPDIEVSLSDEYKNNPTEETDNQLNEALRVLSE